LADNFVERIENSINAHIYYNLSFCFFISFLFRKVFVALTNDMARTTGRCPFPGASIHDAGPSGGAARSALAL
jgi:hypothetical protein